MRQEVLLLIFKSYFRCIMAYIFYIGIIQVLISCHYKNSADIENFTQKTASLEVYCYVT